MVLALTLMNDAASFSPSPSCFLYSLAAGGVCVWVCVWVCVYIVCGGEVGGSAGDVTDAE